jgi:hypothetical protein
LEGGFEFIVGVVEVLPGSLLRDGDFFFEDDFMLSGSGWISPRELF